MIVRRSWVEWDKQKVATFMAKPGGVCHGCFEPGSSFPALVRYRTPTPEDGKRTEEWGRCIPGIGIQLGVFRWESGMQWAVFRRVRWPNVADRPDWSPSLADRIRARIAAWWADRQPVTRRGEPSF